MDNNYQEQLELEKNHLNKIKMRIEIQLTKELAKLKNKKGQLIADRKDMYENTSHYSQDFEKLSDAITYLNPIEVKTYDYEATEARIKKYKRMDQSPYFARIDFIEEDIDVDKESIYIGLGNLSDDKTHQTYICDWRAPISSIFYRYGLGRAKYKAPYGDIEGEVTLKRQFEIKRGELEYFFDSSMTIIDDILKQALSQNSSAKMKSIVETIQKEQDIIIRDIENDLLIVQGVAGSGKTSVALHRVAYLMYHGLTDNLSANNIILITPNNLFEKYIDNVLPELGEKNIQALTLEEVFDNVFEEKIKIGYRNQLIEKIIITKDIEEKKLLKRGMEFKLSMEFLIIIDRYLRHFEHRMLDFRDIFYSGECIVNRHLIKSKLLQQNDISLPLEKRLETIEKKTMLRIHELRKRRLDKLEKFIGEYPEHIYEVKPLARLLSLKENSALKKEINKFTRVDALEVLKRLVGDKNLFYRMAHGLKLPENIEDILNQMKKDLGEQVLQYDNGMVLLATKLKLAGSDGYKGIMQVVVDEAQDYYPVQYEILKKLFSNAKFTVMGDINQTIEKTADLSVYSDIKQVLDKKRSSTVLMKKSFRCSYEINRFSTCFGDKDIEIESFERFEGLPEVIKTENREKMEKTMTEKVHQYRAEGYQSIAVICKSMTESDYLYKNVGKQLGAVLINQSSFESINQVTILPVYMAKGLEFDAVILWDTSDQVYKDSDDRQLLYISCTRALHRLSLMYTGNKSRLIPDFTEANYLDSSE
ncbi:MAG: ATP-dependent helicase [Eubacterium sp.]|nr:ATP-dependent helicase [Eubacterium sp.]